MLNKTAFSTVFAFFAPLFLVSSLVPPFALSDDSKLPCLKNGAGQLAVMNEQVLRWKKETPNQYLDRALIQGTSVRLIKTTKTHIHIEVRIGDGARDLVEVIYSKDFGKLPKIQPGMTIEACGDYITSTAPSNGYQASPDGALIHWVHMNLRPETDEHEDGYLRIDNVTYGRDPKSPKEFLEIPLWLEVFAN